MRTAHLTYSSHILSVTDFNRSHVPVAFKHSGFKNPITGPGLRGHHQTLMPVWSRKSAAANRLHISIHTDQNKTVWCSVVIKQFRTSETCKIKECDGCCKKLPFSVTPFCHLAQFSFSVILCRHNVVGPQKFVSTTALLQMVEWLTPRNRNSLTCYLQNLVILDQMVWA